MIIVNGGPSKLILTHDAAKDKIKLVQASYKKAFAEMESILDVLTENELRQIDGLEMK